MSQAQPQKSGQGIWPDGSSGPKWLWPCEHGDWLHPLVEPYPVPSNHTCAECGVKPVPILPASLCEDLVGALETISASAEVDAAKFFDGDAEAEVAENLGGIADRALVRYREAVAEGGGAE